MNTTQCKYDSLKTQTGLDEQIMDMLLVYYQNNGATSENIDDAERGKILPPDFLITLKTPFSFPSRINSNGYNLQTFGRAS